MKIQNAGDRRARKTRLVIRACKVADLQGVAILAARLVREHHRMDPDRFFIFDRIEEGYEAYLRSELVRKGSVVLVAAEGRKIVGYAYGRIEPRDWNALRERCGALHDIYVDEGARRRGIASRLAEEMVSRLASLGAPRVFLMTATPNVAAQKLFKRLGFRTTMLEMTRECSPPSCGNPRT